MPEAAVNEITDHDGQHAHAQRQCRPLACLAVLCATLLLGACASSPGMHFDPKAPVTAIGPDAMPNITPITLEVVRNQRTMAQREVEKLDELYGKPQPYLIGPGDIV